MVKYVLVLIGVLWFSPALAAESALKVNSEERPGLSAHYYGNPTFWYYVGAFPAESMTIKKDLGKLKWPGVVKYEKGKCLFSRQQGWSAAIYGALKIEKTGEYKFLSKGNQAQLKLGNVFVDLAGKKSIALKKGKIPLQLLVKSDYDPVTRRGPKNMRMGIVVKWREPGKRDYTNIPPENFSHSSVDEKRKAAFKPEILLKDGKIPFIGMREYTFEIKENGFYEFAMQFAAVRPWFPYYADVKLDGEFLYHYRNRGGGRISGFMNTLGAVRYFRRGNHSIRISSHSTHLTFTDMTGFIEGARIGLSRISPKNPELTLGITEKGREDMVFSKGEKLTIKFERATNKNGAQYQVEIRRQRSGEEPIWTADVKLPLEKEYAVSEAVYHCKEEGAFEYQVRDSSGKIIEGPWAFVVIDPTPLPLPKIGDKTKSAPKVLVDSVDCWNSGDREHLFRDNGTSKVVKSKSGKYRVTGKSRRYFTYFRKEKNGKFVRLKKGEKPRRYRDPHYLHQDWFAYTLKVKNPGKPHMVTIYIPTDSKRVVSVQGFDHVTGQYNGAVMDVGDTPQSSSVVPLSFLMWPNGKAIDVTTFCDNDKRWETQNRQGAIQRIELYEYPDGLPPLPEAAAGWSRSREFGWQGEQVNLGMEQRMMPKFWRNNEMIPGVIHRFKWFDGYYDWKALREVWQRFGELSRWRGDNFIMWPVHTYGLNVLQTDHMPKNNEAFSRGYKYRDVDRMRRDQFKMILLLCQKYGVKFVADFQFHRIYQGNVLVTDKQGIYRKGKNLGTGYSNDGIYLIALDGKPFTKHSGAAMLNPAHPLARQYMIDMYGEIAEKYGKYPAFGGVHIRQTAWQSNDSGWFFNSSVGYGNFTVNAFERETKLKVPVKSNDPQRFQKRRKFLMDKKNRKAWFDWRCAKTFTLRVAILNAIRKHAPQAMLYGDQDPVYAKGQGLDEKLMAGRRDLGFNTRARFGVGPHIEQNGLDPECYKNFDVRKVKLKWKPENIISGYERTYPMGLCAGRGSSIRPQPYQLKNMSKFVAENDLQTAIYGGPWVLPAMDEGIRKWAQAWRAIPDLDYQVFDNDKKGPKSVVCKFAKTGNDFVFYLINQGDRKQTVNVRMSNSVDSIIDLVSGVKTEKKNKSFPVTIEPFMLALFKADGGGDISIEGIEDDSPQEDGPRPITMSSPWWNKGWPRRFAITFNETKGIRRRRELVVVTGRQILDNSSAKTISTNSIRVVLDKKLIPFQVDEKDGTGSFVKEPNHVLDMDDEICLQLSIPANDKRTIFIYHGKEGKEKAVFKSDLTCLTVDKLSRKQPYNVLLKNSLMEVGISGQEKDDKEKWKQWHPGAISYLRSKGINMLWSYRANSNIPARINWPSLPKKPQIITQGPVRIIAKVDFEPCDLEWSLDRNWAQDGHLLNARRSLYYQVTAKSGLIDFTEVIRYDKAIEKEFRSCWHYMYVAVGGVGVKANHQVFYSLDEKPKSLQVGKALANKFSNGKLANHGSLGDTYDGWLAYYDPRRKNGFAIFGTPGENRLRLTFFKGMPFFTSNNHTSSFYLIYRTRQIPKNQISRNYGFLVFHRGNAKTLMKQRNSYLTPLKTTINGYEVIK